MVGSLLNHCCKISPSDNDWQWSGNGAIYRAWFIMVQSLFIMVQPWLRTMSNHCWNMVQQWSFHRGTVPTWQVSLRHRFINIHGEDRAPFWESVPWSQGVLSSQCPLKMGFTVVLKWCKPCKSQDIWLESWLGDNMDLECYRQPCSLLVCIYL